MGLFEAAEPPLCSSRESSLLVPKQLRGDQRGRQCSTVHADKGTSSPLRTFVDGTSDELLAGASLSRDEHCGIGWSHSGDPRKDGLQRLGRTDNFLEHLSAVDLISQRQVFPIELILERSDLCFSLFLLTQIEGEGDAVGPALLEQSGSNQDGHAAAIFADKF